MPTKLLLPPMIENTRVPLASQAGVWTGYDGELLDALATSLQSNNPTLAFQAINSIPDAWAQVELFQAALDARQEAAIASFRGLLALFALRQQLNLPLTLHSIDLDKCIKNPYSNDTNNAAADSNNFAEVMKVLPPSNVLHTSLNWLELMAIRVSNCLVGLVVPSTLVCPAVNPASVEMQLQLANAVPWYDAKHARFGNPCLSECKLSPVELAALYQFLDKLGIVIGKEADGPKRLRGVLVSIIQQYKDDCLQSYLILTNNNPVLDGINGLKFQRKGNPAALPKHSIYQEMSQEWEPIWHTDTLSHLLLPKRAELPLEFCGAILCDMAAARLDKDGRSLPHATQVWKQHFLAAVLANPEQAKTIADQAARAGYLLLSADTLFTRYLVELVDSELGGHGDGTKNNLHGYLLPLVPSALLLWSPQELLHRVKIERHGDNCVVSLTVQIQDPQGNREVTLMREYDSNQVKKQRMPTTLSQWPLVQSGLWHSPHFLFYGGQPGSQVTPVFPLSIAALSALLNNASALDWIKIAQWLNQNQTLDQEAMSKVNSLPLPGSIQGTLSEYITIEYKQKPQTIKRVLYRTVQAPEILICNGGLIVLPQITFQQANSTGWEVAVDFGASNTMVYYRPQEGSATKQLDFKTGAHLIAKYNDGNAATRMEHNEFVPLAETSAPFMTILRSRLQSDDIEKRPLWSHHIYYIHQIKDALHRLSADSSRLKLGFKFSADANDRTLTLLFLEQVIMHVMVEAASNGIAPSKINWHFSYPESYSHADLRHFQNLINQAVRQTIGSQNTPKIKIDFVAESLATARYFAHTSEGTFVGHGITVDIGGGSSDMTVWDGGKLLWRTSLRLAGKDIIIAFLRKHRNDFLQALSQNSDPEFRTLVNDINDKFKNADNNTLEAALEVLVNSDLYQQAMDSGFTIHAGGVLEPLIHLARFALAGILYYVGVAMNALKIEHQQDSPLTLCLGGRGSRLYKSLFSGHINDDIGPTVNVLSAACGNAKFSTRVVISDRPKGEVAYGLLMKNQLPNGTSLQTDDRVYLLPIGESLLVSGAKITPETPIDEIDPEGEWKVDQLQSVDKFIRACREHLQLKLVFQDSDRLRWINEANQVLAIARTSAKNNAQQDGTDIHQESQNVEPVFITILRNIIVDLVAGNYGVKLTVVSKSIGWW